MSLLVNYSKILTKIMQNYELRWGGGNVSLVVKGLRKILVIIKISEVL